MKAKNKRFWEWRNSVDPETKTEERTLHLNGAIAEESWFDDDVTPQLFKEELFSGEGDITLWINSPGGDCVAAAQIYNMLMDYKGNILNRHEFEQALGDGEEQGSLVCCSPWGHKELGTT